MYKFFQSQVREIGEDPYAGFSENISLSLFDVIVV
jgi:hypothetical protein